MRSMRTGQTSVQEPHRLQAKGRLRCPPASRAGARMSRWARHDPVAVPAAAPEDRAGVHAGAAADAVQRAAEAWLAEDVRSAVVHQHDVQLAARPRAVKVRACTW